jgi:hypothetical protein
MKVVFKKSGEEIKQAIRKRQEQLQERLDRRNQALDEFMKNAKKVRSYLVRSSTSTWGHYREKGYTLFSKDDISSEEMEEVSQLCNRIYQIEQEMHRLSLIVTHLNDTQVFDLSFEDLIAYGFEPDLAGE